jgi:predicted enzyme related to lactoylglutathione lyase
VAGLVPRAASKSARPSRWIGYVAVNDIASTLASVTKAGGEIHAPAREFPDRGRQAIIADNEGSPIGVLQSSSGDSVDDEPKPGDWNWFELYAQKPPTVCAFYGQVFGFETAPDTRT